MNEFGMNGRPVGAADHVQAEMPVNRRQSPDAIDASSPSEKGGGVSAIFWVIDKASFA